MASDDIERFRPYGRHQTPALSLSGLDTLARVVSVHDGDTLTAVVPFAGSYYRFQVRLEGIDTCELRSTANANRELAQRARLHLSRLVLECGQGHAPDIGASVTAAAVDGLLDESVCLVRLVCGGFDKYGRLLAAVFRGSDGAPPHGSPSFNDALVGARLAYRYAGGTKLTEAQQLEALSGARAGQARP